MTRSNKNPIIPLAQFDQRSIIPEFQVVGRYQFSSGGWVLDAGCESLTFSACAYAASSSVVFIDQSIRMLRHARSRMKKMLSTIPDSMIFLQGYVRHLPFKTEAFGTVISWKLLHVCRDITAVLLELKRVLVYLRRLDRARTRELSQNTTSQVTWRSFVDSEFITTSDRLTTILAVIILTY